MSGIQENWLFRLSNNNSGFLYLSFQDITYSSNFYYGTILNKPSIKESINLVTSSSNTSGISIDIPDFLYKGNPISQELFGGTNSYTNRECIVYSMINKQTPTQIGSFRVTGMSTNGNKISISMTSHRPWDFISIPITRTTDRNLPVPIAYGNYTRNSASTQTSPQFVTDLSSYAYRPVLYNKTHNGLAIYPNTKVASSEAELAIYNQQFDIFIPLVKPNATTVSTDNANHAQAEANAHHIFGVRPDSHFLQAQSPSNPIHFTGVGATGHEPTSIDVANLSNIYDADLNSRATFAMDFIHANQTVQQTYSLKINTPEEEETFRAVTNTANSTLALDGSINSSTTSITVTEDVTSNGNLETPLFVNALLKLYEEKMIITAISSNGLVLTVLRGQLNTTAITHYDKDLIQSTDDYNIFTFKYAVNITHAHVTSSGSDAFMAFAIGTQTSNFSLTSIQESISANEVSLTFPSSCKNIQFVVAWRCQNINKRIAGTLSLYDCRILASRHLKEPAQELFIASDGLTHGITGIANNAITSINNAHLDLLNRFTGLDVATNPASNIDGWSSLESNRSSWDIRAWFNEEIELKQVLQKMQFEGAFIFRYKQGDSTKPQYIHIKDSYSNQITITKNDISNVKLSHTNFSDLITKMVVDFEKHPANNEHRSQETETNTSVRTKYNIPTLENIKTYKLDFLVDSGDIESDDAPNDSFIDYYKNLIGDLKLNISFSIVNPDLFTLEVGSIIVFDNDNMYPKTPFGYNSGSWSNLNFMIINTSKTLGKVNITARQV